MEAPNNVYYMSVYVFVCVCLVGNISFLVENKLPRLGEDGWAALGKPGWPVWFTLSFKLLSEKPSRKA